MAVRRYMFGQWCDLAVLEFDVLELVDGDVDVDFDEWLAVAAFAMAAPPPTSAPETLSATSAVRRGFIIALTSFLSLAHRPSQARGRARTLGTA